MMDLSILGYKFMQNALLAGFLGGIACSLLGVFVVIMGISFIGVAMSHAAFAGALLGAWLGFDPMLGAFLFSIASAGIIGPLADRGEFNPDTSIGLVFSLTMGLAFLFMGKIEGPKTIALDLLWGSILTVKDSELWLLGIVAAVIVLLILLFFKQIKTVLFNRELALASGLPSGRIFYTILFFIGLVISVSFRSIGGLLIFNLIINPAAAAYQLTYNLRNMFILSAVFGVSSCWIGLLLSYVFSAPSGAAIVIVSCLIFLACVSFSPKRKVVEY